MAIVSQFVTLSQLDSGPDPATKAITGVQAGSLLVVGAAFYRPGLFATTDPAVTDSAGTVLKADTSIFLFFSDSMGCGLWYVENAAAGTHTFSFPLGGGVNPTIYAFIAEVPAGFRSASLDQHVALSHALADFATTDSVNLPLTTKAHSVRFSIFTEGNAAGGNTNIGITPPSGDTGLNASQNNSTSIPAEESYQEFFANAARTSTWNWSDATATTITSAMVAANFALIDAGPAIGAARSASRYAGPQVQRFLFRARQNELFGGVILDPPGEIIRASRIANPGVGPSALRRVFRQRSFQWPVVPAGGATTVLAPLATHTYTGQVPQVRARVAPAQATHTYTAQVPQVRVKVQPAQATHTYTAQVPQVRVKIQPAQATHTYTARVPQVRPLVQPAQATHTYTAQVPQVRVKVQPAQATHTYTAQVPQVRVKVQPAQATHTYTGRVPNIVTGSAVVPPTATHSYTARTPQAKARVAPAAMTHSYTGQAPQARSKVQPAQVTHAYTARAPQARANVQPAPAAHSYLGRVPQAKSKVAPAAAVHTYSGRIPAVQAGNVVFVTRAIHVYAGVAPSITAAPPVYGSPTRPAIGDGGARPAQTGGARPAQIDTSRRRN